MSTNSGLQVGDLSGWASVVVSEADPSQTIWFHSNRKQCETNAQEALRSSSVICSAGSGPLSTMPWSVTYSGRTRHCPGRVVSGLFFGRLGPLRPVKFNLGYGVRPTLVVVASVVCKWMAHPIDPGKPDVRVQGDFAQWVQLAARGRLAEWWTMGFRECGWAATVPESIQRIFRAHPFVNEFQMTNRGIKEATRAVEPSHLGFQHSAAHIAKNIGASLRSKLGVNVAVSPSSSRRYRIDGICKMAWPRLLPLG